MIHQIIRVVFHDMYDFIDSVKTDKLLPLNIDFSSFNNPYYYKNIFLSPYKFIKGDIPKNPSRKVRLIRSYILTGFGCNLFRFVFHLSHI